MNSQYRICASCVLPENFPGIKFNDQGVCDLCTSYKKQEDPYRKKLEYQKRFEKIIQENKGLGQYDALMCYSGGKDSTYTLALLKEQYSLKILAVSFDNGFLPPQTLTNIKNVIEQIGVDHILFKPRFDVLAKVFRSCAHENIFPAKTLERSSAICTSCMAIIKYVALRFALEKNIPLVAYGWSPGQAPISSSIFKNNPQMIDQMQRSLLEPLLKIAGDEIRAYFLEPKHFQGGYQFPYNIHPLAFLDYDIDKIYAYISRFDWKKPEETDANSTNCMLNSYANFIHKQKTGFHPYAFELANLVRGGYLDRDSALQRLRDPENPAIVKMVDNKLG